MDLARSRSVSPKTRTRVETRYSEESERIVDEVKASRSRDEAPSELSLGTEISRSNVSRVGQGVLCASDWDKVVAEGEKAGLIQLRVFKRGKKGSANLADYNTLELSSVFAERGICLNSHALGEGVLARACSAGAQCNKALTLMRGNNEEEVATARVRLFRDVLGISKVGQRPIPAAGGGAGAAEDVSKHGSNFLDTQRREFEASNSEVTSSEEEE